MAIGQLVRDGVVLIRTACFDSALMRGQQRQGFLGIAAPLGHLLAIGELDKLIARQCRATALQLRELLLQLGAFLVCLGQLAVALGQLGFRFLGTLADLGCLLVGVQVVLARFLVQLRQFGFRQLRKRGFLRGLDGCWAGAVVLAKVDHLGAIRGSRCFGLCFRCGCWRSRFGRWRRGGCRGWLGSFGAGLGFARFSQHLGLLMWQALLQQRQRCLTRTFYGERCRGWLTGNVGVCHTNGGTLQAQCLTLQTTA